MNGLVLIDKPAGCTSHDVVNRWRRLSGIKRVGHLGTLDPMATGLLALMTGTATRLAQFFVGEGKTYVAQITLGLVSTTYDAAGTVTSTGATLPSTSSVEAALACFRGKIEQVPPAVSAKKINGVPAYKLARKGLPVELRPVTVEIRKLQLDEFSGNTATLTIDCSSGTYIRSLAHDLGQRLGCGAVLSRLRRTAIGRFRLDDAWRFEALEALSSAGKLGEAITPTGSLLPHMPSEHFDLPEELRIRQGRDFQTSPFVVPPGTPHVKALSIEGELIAIGELRFPNVYHPSTVL